MCRHVHRLTNFACLQAGVHSHYRPQLRKALACMHLGFNMDMSELLMKLIDKTQDTVAPMHDDTNHQTPLDIFPGPLPPLWDAVLPAGIAYASTAAAPDFDVATHIAFFYDPGCSNSSSATAPMFATITGKVQPAIQNTSTSGKLFDADSPAPPFAATASAAGQCIQLTEEEGWAEQGLPKLHAHSLEIVLMAGLVASYSTEADWKAVPVQTYQASVWWLATQAEAWMTIHVAQTDEYLYMLPALEPHITLISKRQPH